jgi:hypothetical protein
VWQAPNSDLSPAGKLTKGDVAGGFVETAAIVTAEGTAVAAAIEIASHVTAGADTVITGLGGSVIYDLIDGNFASVGVKALGIGAAVLFRRWLSDQGSLAWLTNLIGRAIKALFSLATQMKR